MPEQHNVYVCYRVSEGERDGKKLRGCEYMFTLDLEVQMYQKRETRGISSL